MAAMSFGTHGVCFVCLYLPNRAATILLDEQWIQNKNENSTFV